MNLIKIKNFLKSKNFMCPLFILHVIKIIKFIDFFSFYFTLFIIIFLMILDFYILLKNKSSLI